MGTAVATAKSKVYSVKIVDEQAFQVDKRPVEKFMLTNPLSALKICTVAFVPVALVIIKLLPKFLQSGRSIKMLIGAIVLSMYTAVLVATIDSSSLPIQNFWFVVVLNALVWSGVGFLVGIYFDVRSRVEMGSKYYQEFWHLRLHGVEYGVLGAIASLPLGFTAGWLVIALDTLWLVLLLSFSTGFIIGGVLVWGLDRYNHSFFSG